MCFFLGTHCGGRRCALPPAPPHPLLFFNRLPLFPLLPSILFVFHKHHRLFFLFFISIWVHFIFIDIHRDLSLCASFLVRIAGGRRCALPPAPAHPLLFFNRLPLLPTRFHFFHRHRFVGFIFSVLIFINIHRDLSLCASFLVRIAGGGAAPSPLHPPTRFYFLTGSPCYLLFFCFS